MPKIPVFENKQLMSEWNWEKNNALGNDPHRLACGSAKMVWWKCKNGHEWDARIVNRRNGCGCPVCSNKRVQIGINDLATTHPRLALEWHPTKNGDLTPQSVPAGSNKKVWWQCKKGHEWQTTVSHRCNSESCPICQREYKTSFPEQAIFFYLRQVTAVKNRYMLDSRTEIDVFLPDIHIGIEYDGIYYHSDEKAEKRENRKQETLSKHEILLIRVKESKENTPNDPAKHIIITPPGPRDEELNQTIGTLLAYINRIKGTAFSVDIDISRDRVKIYEQFIDAEKANSLTAVNPALASEWHPTKNGKLRPEHFSVSSNKKVWWQCKEGHEWQAVINSRKNGVGCPYCAGKRAIAGLNDLFTVNPTLAAEWHPTKNGKLTPAEVTASSNRTVWWQCKKGHEWKAMIYDRSKGCNCPVCSGHKVLVGYNDLTTANPRLAAEWHPTRNGTLKPTDVTAGTDKKVWWRCSKGHEWEAIVYSRSSGCGCPFCSGQKVISGENDLATAYPALAAEWHPTKNGKTTPSQVMPGANAKAWWLGKCGHEWEAVISSRVAGRGCPYCASQRLLLGFNDLATVNPTLASEWHPTKNGSLTPRDVMANSNKRVWWLCAKGHEWENTINVRNSGHKCPYCANQMVWVGYNDLLTTNSALAAQWHPTKNGDRKPTDYTAGANKKAWWICDQCGHEWEALISSRNKGHGCPICGIKKRVESRKKNNHKS